MNIQYDVQDLPSRKHTGGKQSEIVTKLQAFMATSQKNMVITFDDVKDAKRATTNLSAFLRTHDLKDAFEVYRADKSVVVLKTRKKRGNV